MGRKARDLDVVIHAPSAYAEEAGKLIPVNGPIDYRWKGRQVTDSEGHKRSRNGSYYEGGPFFTVRCEASVPTRHVKLKQRKSGIDYVYSGPIAMPMPQNLGAGFSVPTAPSNLDTYGTDAIAAVEPTNPNASTGVALGEIMKDRRLPIPVINSWKRRTEAAKAASSEYLNAVFGWLPLVSDMKDTAQSVLDGNTIMENYRNASGTNVHREFEFPPIESFGEEQLTSADVLGPRLPAFSSGEGVLTRTVRTTTKRWFSGAFTYYADGSNSHLTRCMGIGSEAEKLFGISLTPDLVWELTPWSWAVDWFSNASSVIHNTQAMKLAGSVMRYGYIMEEHSSHITYTMTGSPIRGYPGIVPPPASITITSKQRSEANPFGFGLQWDGLSPTQLAITAALGITRLR